MKFAPPSGAFSAYVRHKSGSKRRGIPFRITFNQWWNWWAMDDRWSRRGRSACSLVMARHGDVGPYAISNIYCATHAQNVRDGHFFRRRPEKRNRTLIQILPSLRMKIDLERAINRESISDWFERAAVTALKSKAKGKCRE